MVSTIRPSAEGALRIGGSTPTDGERSELRRSEQTGSASAASSSPFRLAQRASSVGTARQHERSEFNAFLAVVSTIRPSAEGALRIGGSTPTDGERSELRRSEQAACASAASSSPLRAGGR